MRYKPKTLKGDLLANSVLSLGIIIADAQLKKLLLPCFVEIHFILCCVVLLPNLQATVNDVNHLTPTMGTAIKHPVPDRVKSSFVIFGIRAVSRSALSVRVPGCQKLQMTTT